MLICDFNKENFRFEYFVIFVLSLSFYINFDV